MPLLRPDSGGVAAGLCSGRGGLVFAVGGGAGLAGLRTGLGAGRAGATFCSRGGATDGARARPCHPGRSSTTGSIVPVTMPR